MTLERVTPRGIHKGISAHDGLVATGKATNLPPGSSVWLMDQDLTGGYTIAQRAIVSHGTWGAESYPVGDTGDRLPFAMRSVVVLATAACAGQLRRLDEAGQSNFETLPAGCVEEDGRDILVSEQ